MPTNVLSKYTWVRNGRLAAIFPVLPLYVELGFAAVELGGVGVFRAPAFRAGGGLGVGGISYSPLLLLFGLRFACLYALVFAIFSSGVSIALPAGFAVCAFLLCCHFFLPPFLGLGLVDLVP